jgi:hypothetical protein
LGQQTRAASARLRTAAAGPPPASTFTLFEANGRVVARIPVTVERPVPGSGSNPVLEIRIRYDERATHDPAWIQLPAHWLALAATPAEKVDYVIGTEVVLQVWTAVFRGSGRRQIPLFLSLCACLKPLPLAVLGNSCCIR